MTPYFPAPRTDWCLFLDFDGTLVEIAESPDAVRAERHLAATLTAISARLGGAVAIVSGRPIAEVERHLDHEGFPAAGLHGLEMRMRAGQPISRADASAPDAGVRDALASFAASRPGLLLEDKGIALALHYRARPDLADACRDAVKGAVAGRGNLHVLEGKMVFEVKPSAADKGRAVRRFMDEAPFAGRVPVFAGDDVTDEDGFIAAAAFGGFGIKIGAGETAARWRIGTVAEFVRWLVAMPGRLDRSARETASQ
ncbi:trehalose-phosphatase [Microbaculum sp. FT89]|uniref:trehalose-phosphatase n=1 Tax=Microbaculum sp. FT89 TaxID=3447298 RepID=UPI003F533544